MMSASSIARFGSSLVGGTAPPPPLPPMPPAPPAPPVPTPGSPGAAPAPLGLSDSKPPGLGSPPRVVESPSPEQAKPKNPRAQAAAQVMKKERALRRSIGKTPGGT